MDFEWDEGKNRSNIRKHGISFETALTIFNHPIFSLLDTRNIYDEDRFITIGVASNNVVIVVVHSYREESIRLISARPASRKERKIYYEKV